MIFFQVDNEFTNPILISGTSSEQAEDSRVKPGGSKSQARRGDRGQGHHREQDRQPEPGAGQTQRARLNQDQEEPGLVIFIIRSQGSAWGGKTVSGYPCVSESGEHSVFATA